MRGNLVYADFEVRFVFWDLRPRNKTRLGNEDNIWREPAFHLSSRTVRDFRGAFCSRKMANNPKLLPIREDLLRNVRTRSGHPKDTGHRSR